MTYFISALSSFLVWCLTEHHWMFSGYCRQIQDPIASWMRSGQWATGQIVMLPEKSSYLIHTWQCITTTPLTPDCKCFSYAVLLKLECEVVQETKTVKSNKEVPCVILWQRGPNVTKISFLNEQLVISEPFEGLWNLWALDGNIFCGSPSITV